MNDCIKKVPRSYQKECVKLAESNKKGIFELTCGSGKSIIMLEIASKHKISVICVPTKGLAMQFCKSDVCGCLDGNLSGNAKNYVDKYFVFNSDRTHNDEVRLKSLLSGKYKESDKILFIVNYQSLAQFLLYIEESNEGSKYTPIDIDVIMFDEAHLTTGVARRNISSRAANKQEEDDMQFSPVESINKIEKVNNKVKKFYFTATPNLKMIANKDLYGKVLFSLRYPEAIRLRNLTPFENIMFKIDENGLYEDGTHQKMKYKNIIQLVLKKINEHSLKRVIIYTSFAEGSQGSSRYGPIKTSVGNFEKHILKFGEMPEGVSFKYFYARNPIDERVSTLADWFDVPGDGVKIIIACRTISEGIDVRLCDGIFLFDQDKSVATTIQRAMRASRLPRVQGEKNSVSKVFIPCLDNVGHKANLVAIIQDTIHYYLKEGRSSYSTEKRTNNLFKRMTPEQIQKYIQERTRSEDANFKKKEMVSRRPSFLDKEIVMKDEKKNIDWVSVTEEWVRRNGQVKPRGKDVIVIDGVTYKVGVFMGNVMKEKRKKMYNGIQPIIKEILGIENND